MSTTNQNNMKTLYKDIKLKEIKRDSLIKDSKLFTYIDSDFVKYGADIPNKQNTPALLCEVKELTENMTFKQMFDTPDTQWLTQGQILQFIENNKDKLRDGSYATFFLFKSGEDFFVTSVRVSSSGLCVRVYRLGYGPVWDAESRLRLVVPQLETKSLNTKSLSTLESLALTDEQAIEHLKSNGYKITKIIEKEY